MVFATIVAIVTGFYKPTYKHPFFGGHHLVQIIEFSLSGPYTNPKWVHGLHLNIVGEFRISKKERCPKNDPKSSKHHPKLWCLQGCREIECYLWLFMAPPISGNPWKLPVSESVSKCTGIPPKFGAVSTAFDFPNTKKKQLAKTMANLRYPAKKDSDS